MKTMTRDPSWWTRDYDSAWDRVREAFRRDWEQTKHDFGANARDLQQDVNDTVGQAAGRKPIPPLGQPNHEEHESAYRFGYGARRHYGSDYPEWNDALEARLRSDWERTDMDPNLSWDRHRMAIRHGWDYHGR